MTQRSLPQDGAYPTYIDGGPYSALVESRRTAFMSPNKSTGFELAVTSTGVGTATVVVQPGEAIVDGTYLSLDNALTFNVNFSGLAATATSFVAFAVVAISNRSGVPITTAGETPYNYALNFPTDLTDYKSLSSIPDDTVRIALLVRNDENLMNTSPLWNTPGNTVLMFCNVTVYDMDGIYTISNPVKMKFPRSQEDFSMILGTSIAGTGSISVTVPVNSNSKSLLVKANIFAPMRGITGSFDYLDIALSIGATESANASQKIYMNGVLLGSGGLTPSKIYICDDDVLEWTACSLEITLTRHYNYVFVSGYITFSQMSNNYTGIGTHVDGSSSKRSLYGLIYLGDTLTDSAEISTLGIISPSFSNTMGCGSTISYRSL